MIGLSAYHPLPDPPPDQGEGGAGSSQAIPPAQTRLLPPPGGGGEGGMSDTTPDTPTLTPSEPMFRSMAPTPWRGGVGAARLRRAGLPNGCFVQRRCP